jgi:hypothetical protein
MEEQQRGARQIIRRISRPRGLDLWCIAYVGVHCVRLQPDNAQEFFQWTLSKTVAHWHVKLEQGDIENVYRLQIMNGLEQAQRYSVSVRGLAGLRISSDAQLAVQSVAIASLPVRLTLAPEAAAAYRGKTLPIVFEVQTTADGRSEVRHEKSTFYVLP